MQQKSQFITADTSQPVFQAYRDLNRAIDEMDKKVQHVIKKHQAQFLYAYRNHISKIKKQLAEIKHKSQEQEKMFSSNDRIQYLEKQMVIFREEALKLYSKLDVMTQENQFLKNRIKEIEKEHHDIQQHQREQIKSFKIQGMNKSMVQSRNEQLQLQLQRKNEEISKLHRKIESIKEESLRRSVFQNREARVSSFASNTKRESFKDRPKKIEIYDSQMKDWFIDCIKTVKREVAMRNNSNNLLDLNFVTGIEQFKTVDKLRLLELFLQNEKLLTWMYQRIFPDRLSKLRSNLSSHNDSILSNEKSQQEYNISPIEKGLLPRVNRYARNEIRNSLVIKNGKLNISQT